MENRNAIAINKIIKKIDRQNTKQENLHTLNYHQIKEAADIFEDEGKEIFTNRKAIRDRDYMM